MKLKIIENYYDDYRKEVFKFLDTIYDSYDDFDLIVSSLVDEFDMDEDEAESFVYDYESDEVDLIYNSIDELVKDFNDAKDLINWKRHADAPVPGFEKNMINVYEFNKDTYEPLRPKYVSMKKSSDNNLIIDWICQEKPYSLTGMKNEIKRFFKDNVNVKTKVKVNVVSRDNEGKTSFTFTNN